MATVADDAAIDRHVWRTSRVRCELRLRRQTGEVCVQANLHLRAALLAAITIFCVAGISIAQGTGRSMDIDISARSAALGGASTALLWGDLNHWANPALLGYVQGVRYVHGRTRLVPGLANDVHFTTDVVQVGDRGLGVLVSGKPLDRGGVFLDYGSSEGRDESGNPTGSFNSYERVHAAGAGANVAQLIEGALSTFGMRSPNLSRYADASFGITSKHTEIALAPAYLGGHGLADSRDWGWLVRVTPFDGFATGPVPVRLDATYGRADINYHLDHLVVFINADQGSPVTRMHRRGAAAHLSIGRMPSAAAAPRGWSVLMRGLSPLLALTWTDDRTDVGVLDEIQYRTQGHGLELTIAQVLSYRRGHYADRTGQIDGDTWGWGVALPLGDIAGAAYDDAHFPQASDSGLRPLHRQMVTAWIDVFAIWRAAHRGTATMVVHSASPGDTGVAAIGPRDGAAHPKLRGTRCGL